MEMKDLVIKFQKTCPDLVRQMMNSDHNFSLESGILSPHHIEGTVFTHTMMVCLLAEQHNVSDIVKLACLLHDVGKPMARQVFTEECKVKFIGHEPLSVFIALDCLKKMEINLSNEDLSLLVNLISHHTSLFHTLDSKDYESKILNKFKKNKNLLENLITLSKCDALGRFAEDKMKVLKLEENLVPLLDKIDIEEIVKDSEATITLLVGPPLSGKTTWIKDNKKAAIVISRDEILMKMSNHENYNDAWNSVDQNEVDREFNVQLSTAVKARKDIIIDKTNCSLRSRRSILGQVPKSYFRKAVVFYTPYEELLKRGVVRTVSESKYVDERSIQEIIKSYFSPLYDSFDEIIEIFNF
jgi:putative nucleotidyltransferase with HDIG domain